MLSGIATDRALQNNEPGAENVRPILRRWPAHEQHLPRDKFHGFLRTGNFGGRQAFELRSTPSASHGHTGPETELK